MESKLLEAYSATYPGVTEEERREAGWYIKLSLTIPGVVSVDYYPPINGVVEFNIKAESFEGERIREHVLKAPQFEPEKPQPKSGPERPDKPTDNDDRDAWFRYYQEMNDNGFKCTLPDIAQEIGLSPQYVKDLHAQWRAENMPIE